jgi:hypothetical protein
MASDLDGNFEIDTIPELVQTVADSRTGGYDVDFEILGNQSRAAVGTGDNRWFFLLIQVTFHEPDMSRHSGEYWFDGGGNLEQVL